MVIIWEGEYAIIKFNFIHSKIYFFTRMIKTSLNTWIKSRNSTVLILSLAWLSEPRLTTVAIFLVFLRSLMKMNEYENTIIGQETVITDKSRYWCLKIMLNPFIGLKTLENFLKTMYSKLIFMWWNSWNEIDGRTNKKKKVQTWHVSINFETFEKENVAKWPGQ